MQKLPTRTASGVPYALACAYFGGLDPQHYGAVQALEFGDPPVRLIRTDGVPYIDQARAILATRALELLPDEGVLMMLDHDIIFNPASVPLLVEQCAAGPYDVLGVPYSMRMEAGGLIGFAEPGVVELKCFESGGMYPAFGLGMGFTAIRMRVFRELAKNMQRVRSGTKTIVYPFFALEVQPDHSVLPDGEKIGFYHGEDVSFCRRATAAGFKCGLDTRHRIGHKGSKLYALEDTIYCVPYARNLTIKLKTLDEVADRDFVGQPAPQRAAEERRL